MTVSAIVERNAAQYPDKLALCDLSDTFTFSEVLEKSRQAAAVFQARGISKGDAVAIMGQNSFDFVFAYFGALMAGAVVGAGEPQAHRPGGRLYP